MPVVTFRDFIYDDLGVGVGGIRARAYAKTSVNTRAVTHVSGGEDFSDSGSGMWEITVDTDTSPTGLFTIELYNPSTEQIRWRDGHIRLQVEALIGPGNTLPFPDFSVTSPKLADGSITNAKVSDGVLSSTKLMVADRTIDQAIAAATANTGTLPQLLSWIAKMILGIKGTADWKTAPATTLAAAYAHMTNTANPHSVTAAQVTAVANAGSSVSIKSGNNASKGSGSQGAIYVATDTQQIYWHNGSTWILVGTADYTDLSNQPASVSQSSDFGKILVNGVTLTADAVQDTLNLVAGSGITLTGDAGTDTVTIAASAGGGGAVAAHTHVGGDITSAVPDSSKLGNVNASQYIELASIGHAATGGANLTTSNFKMFAGSVNVSVAGGVGTIFLPLTVTGYVSIVATNGDYDAYTGHIMLKDSNAGGSPYFTFKTSPSVSQIVRVNYVVVYW